MCNNYYKSGAGSMSKDRFQVLKKVVDEIKKEEDLFEKEAIEKFNKLDMQAIERLSQKRTELQSVRTLLEEHIAVYSEKNKDITL